MQHNQILQGEALEVLKTLPDESVDCVMTSPPYWGLRDYGTGKWEGGHPDCPHLPTARAKGEDVQKNSAGSRFNIQPVCSACGAVRVDKQLGLEPTAREFIHKLADIFDEIKRVLRQHGTIWVNLGDTYINYKDCKSVAQTIAKDGRKAQAHEIEKGRSVSRDTRSLKAQGLLDKSLGQIPARFSIEMNDRGWILRNEIIWYKPNCMPSSIKDRFTVDFEKVFFFTKAKKYWFEQQYEPLADITLERFQSGKWEADPEGKLGAGEHAMSPEGFNKAIANMAFAGERNKRCVWKVSPRAYPEAHFATYPVELCETPIKAGCPEFVCKKCFKPREKILEITPEYAAFLGQSWNPHIDDMKMGYGQQTRGHADRKGDVAGVKRYNFKGYTDCGCGAGFQKGVVLDPFFGSGTTAVAARQLGRDWLGIELNPEYIELAKKRLAQGVLL